MSETLPLTMCADAELNMIYLSKDKALENSRAFFIRFS